MLLSLIYPFADKMHRVLSHGNVIETSFSSTNGTTSARLEVTRETSLPRTSLDDATVSTFWNGDCHYHLFVILSILET